MCSSASILDTALDKSLTTTLSLTKTTAYQLRSLYETRAHDMHLLSNFRIPNPRVKIVTAKTNSLFITLPFAVLAVVQPSIQSCGAHTQTMVFVVKHQPRNIFNTTFFEKKISFKEKFPDYSTCTCRYNSLQIAMRSDLKHLFALA